MTDVLAATAGEVSTGEAVAFWVLAPLALLGAIGMVWARNAVHSALWLILTMLSLGVFYVLQAGPFIGMVQIIVYTGAIMMLFLFVLMLIGRDASDSLIETLRGQRIAAIALGLGFAALVGTGVYRAMRDSVPVGLEQANAGGNVQGIAALLFTDYLFAFEATSALLIVAAVGAMIMAHIDRRSEEPTDQPSRMRARFRPGNYPGPKPGPGVFATSSSVATPSRLPDGSLTEKSVSRIMPVRELEPAERALKGTEK